MKTDAMQAHRVYAVEIPADQKTREVKHSWHVISDGVVLYLLVALHLINFAPDTLQNIVITFAIFYAWVETWYYFTHRLMHKYDWLYKFHREHHLSLAVTPLSSISMSSVEKIIFYTGGWLTFMAAVSWIVPVSLYGVVAYYTYHFIISLHGHSNTEATALNAVLAKIGMGSATSHAIHHARFKQNFGFSNMFWDKVCGTYAKDTLEIQRMAIHKQGTKSLKTRLYSS
jgi:sterol desaturase/sphingolipid hydroxylase (fatty acid hydroxylase superfamily)